MLVDLVRLRHQGRKLPNEQLKATAPQRGTLSLQTYVRNDQFGVRQGFTVAKLLEVAPGAEPPLALIDAWVKTIDADGLLIIGAEVDVPKIGNSTTFAQAWWCRFVKA